MRSLFFSLCLLACTSFAFAGNKVIMKKCHGGPNGYNNVKEEHKDGIHSLSCEGPGYEKVHFTTSPGKLPLSLEEAQTAVEKKISGKETHGTIRYKWGSISWEGTDITCYSMTIDVK